MLVVDKGALRWPNPNPYSPPVGAPPPAAVVEAPKTEIGNTYTETDILIPIFLFGTFACNIFYFFLFLIRTSASYTMSTLRFINQCLLVFPSSSLPFSFLSLEFNLPLFYHSTAIHLLLLTLYFLFHFSSHFILPLLLTSLPFSIFFYLLFSILSTARPVKVKSHKSAPVLSPEAQKAAFQESAKTGENC